MTPRDERMVVTTTVDCSNCHRGLRHDGSTCEVCDGHGRVDSYRRPTAADLAAHLRTLPHAERVAAIVALLRACPDAARDAIASCKVAMPWRHVANSALTERRKAGGGEAVVVSAGLDRPHTGPRAGRVIQYWYVHRIAVSGVDLSLYQSLADAQAAADAALLADGWVLAGGVR